MGAEEIFKYVMDENERKKSQTNSNKINPLEQITCPFCQKTFNSANEKQFNNHIKKCGLKKIQISKSCDLYPPSQDIFLNGIIFKNFLKYKSYVQSPNILDKSIDDKIEDLKNYIKLKKKPWEDGCCHLNLNRQNMLKESLDQINNIDFFKELKINFIGEVSYDAGGIIREWFTTIFQALENDKLKLFINSESRDFSYIINPFLIHNEENFQYLKFIGLLIAKALLHNITINLCFNKLIYKMILQEPITFIDLVFINDPLYNSLKNIKESIEYNKIMQGNKFNLMDFLKELGLSYSIESKDSYNHLHSFELIENGRNIPVFDIDDYINKRINFLIGIYEPFISLIRDSLLKYFPRDIINTFTSDEFELLLNGRPFIDLEEWKLFTEYKEPYHPNHQVIIWFWETLSNMSQKELSNLLLFCTGSSRVPLGGFAVLESNRGNIAKFTIECIPYEKNTKNFVKAHTCFNRLDLPFFRNKKETEEAIHFVSSNEVLGFGIE